MSEPFLGEVRIFGFNFAPRGWATCDGQLLPINQNQSLYSLLGTTFGGDGRTTFGLPDLRGRTPIHMGSIGGPNFTMGQKSGEERHTLTPAEMPPHSHTLMASNAPGTSDHAEGAFLAGSESALYYSGGGGNLALAQASVAMAPGAGQSHDNMQPYLVVNICIALQGTFPSRN
jgi:microcystin-dependent protein